MVCQLSAAGCVQCRSYLAGLAAFSARRAAICFWFGALVIRPLLMHLVQTQARWTWPLLSTTLRCCRFGRNQRLVLPVTLRPIPPLYLATPRCTYFLPVTGALSQ